MPPQGQPIQTPPEGFRPSEIPAILEMPVTPQTPEAVPIAPVAPEVIPAPSEIEVPKSQPEQPLPAEVVQPKVEAPPETIVETEKRIDAAVVPSLPQQAADLYHLSESGFDPAAQTEARESAVAENLKNAGFKLDTGD